MSDEIDEAKPPAPEVPEPHGDATQKHQALFHAAWTKAVAMPDGKPGVAIMGDGGIVVYVISPCNAISLALGLIEAAHNAVTNIMVFNSLTESGMSDAEAGRMVTEYARARNKMLRAE